MLIITSALLLHGALCCPQYLCWLVFLYLVPFFFLGLACLNKIDFYSGFLWGIIFFSFHSWGLAKLVITECNGKGRFIFPVLFILYCSIHTGFWFWLIKKTKLLFAKQLQFLPLLLWTFLFFWWAPQGLLWISGDYIGQPLFFPLLPLVQYQKTLQLLPLLGSNFLLLTMMLFSLFIVFFIVTQKKRFLVFVFLCMLPFLYGHIFLQKKVPVSNFVKTVGYICPPDCAKFSHPMDVAQEIYFRMCTLLKKHPHITTIVMPELSYRFALNKHQHVITMWNNNILHDKVQLFIGACHKKKRKVFNSLYWIKNGKIKQIYDKSRLMPLAEYIPNAYKNISWLNHLFLGEKQVFSENKNNNIVFKIEKTVTLEPYICAEIFFKKNNIPIQLPNDCYVLSMCNDTVLLSSSLRHLMFLWNKFKALEFTKSVFFVGYYSSSFISPTNYLILPF